MLKYIYDRSGKVTLKEFEDLFSFQVQAGLYGLISSVLWFLYVFANHPAFWTSGWTTFWAFCVALGFLSILVLAYKYQRNVTRRRITLRQFKLIFGARPPSQSEEWTEEDWLYFARKRMALIVAMFIVTCATLIWLTGGLESPFVPVYVMVFTLVFAYCDIPHPGTVLATTFFVCFLLVGLIFEGWWIFDWSPPVDRAVYANIHGHRYKKVVDLAAVLAAISIPWFATVFTKAMKQPSETTVPPN